MGSEGQTSSPSTLRFRRVSRVEKRRKLWAPPIAVSRNACLSNFYIVHERGENNATFAHGPCALYGLPHGGECPTRTRSSPCPCSRAHAGAAGPPSHCPGSGGRSGGPCASTC